MEKGKLEQLKSILLSEEVENREKLAEELRTIASILEEKEKLQEKVNPIIQERIQEFENEIPEKMGPSITAALKKQISESQNDVIDLLYPIIGKLINKFIKIEIQKLSEKIDSQLSNAFSLDGWKKRLKGWFTGTKESDIVLRSVAAPELEEMFMIEKQSGILIGQYSRNQTVDADMIAGMLTAIKSFVEDAFKQGNDELETIEYENYKITLFNFQTFYVALVISGIVNAEFHEKSHQVVMDFVEKYMKNASAKDNDFSQQLTKYLNEYNF